MTLEQWIYSWMNIYKIRRWRSKTKELYSMLTRTIIVPFLGQMKISEIKPLHIQELVNKMHDDGYSYSTIEKVKNILRPAFESAINNNYISSNPFYKIQLPEKIEKEVIALTRKEQIGFEKYSKKSYYYEFFIIALNTGARCGELLALTWNDVDFEKYEIDINKTLISERDSTGKMILTVQEVPKTKKSNRKIPVPKRFMDIFKNLKQTRAFKKFDDNNIVFCSKVGAYVHSKNLRRSMKIVLDRADIKNKTGVHVLRHTYTTRLFEEKVNIKTISELLGHAKIETTLRYSHIYDDSKKNAVQILNDLDLTKEV
jgi:integrase